jgi:5-methylcytosine-specific restriction enzyme A
MPTSWSNPCSVPGCHMTTKTGQFCTPHRKEKKAAHDAKRPRAAQRGYDAEWQKTRTAIIRQRPVCEYCGGPGEIVDHILPVREGGTNDAENLMTLCRRCHGAKTSKDFTTYQSYKQ